MRYNTFNCTMYSDKLFSLEKSTRGHTASQAFVTDRNCAHVAHISAKSESGDDLLQIFQSVEVPQHMVTDGSKELTQGSWKKRIKENQFKKPIAKNHSQFQNKAETMIW